MRKCEEVISLQVEEMMRTVNQNRAFFVFLQPLGVESLNKYKSIYTKEVISW